MELVKTWLIGVTAAAMITALAESLAPDGAVKKVGRLAGGLLLVIAILQPIVDLDYSAMAGALADYRLEAEGYTADLSVANGQLMKTIIEEQTGAYILDKAAALGAECTVQVTCRVREDEVIYPAEVVVYGELTQVQQQSLSRTIEGDLAIPADCQQYERTNEG